MLWSSEKGSVRVQLGLVHDALHHVDAPRCTGSVKQEGTGAQREASMTNYDVTDLASVTPVPISTASVRGKWTVSHRTTRK